MRTDLYICDWCKKENKEHYSENGWITIDKDGFHVSDNKEIKIYSTLIKAPEKDLHFCSIYCFLCWLFLERINQNNPAISLEKRLNFFIEKLMN